MPEESLRENGGEEKNSGHACGEPRMGRKPAVSACGSRMERRPEKGRN